MQCGQACSPAQRPGRYVELWLRARSSTLQSESDLVYSHRRGASAVDQYFMQIDVASHADAQQPRVAASRVLPWHATRAMQRSLVPCGRLHRCRWRLRSQLQRRGRCLGSSGCGNIPHHWQRSVRACRLDHRSALQRSSTRSTARGSGCASSGSTRLCVLEDAAMAPSA